MGNVKRTLKKFIIYLGAFLAVLTLTAGFKVGVFFITRSPSGTDNNNNSSNVEEVNTSGLSCVLDNVLSSEKSTFVLNMNVKSKQTNQVVSLNSDIYVDFESDNNNQNASKLQNLKLKIVGWAETYNQNVNFQISYLQGYIYASVGQAQFKIKATNIKEDINRVLELATLKKLGVNITLPDLSELSFDPSMLAMIASGLEETETEMGKELKFNLLGYGDVLLETDSEYSLKNVGIDKLEIEGTEISANVATNLNAEKIEIKKPDCEEEFTDFSGLILLADKIDNFFSLGNAQGKITVCALEKQFDIDYSLDFEDLENIVASFKAKIGDKDLVVNYKSNKLFVAYGEYKYYIENPFDVSDLLNAIKFYAGKFGVVVQEVDFKEAIQALNFKDINQVLKYFSEFEITENGIGLNLENFDLNLIAGKDSLERVKLQFADKLDLTITLNETIDKIEFDSSEYKNIWDEPLINVLKSQLLLNKQLSLIADVDVCGKQAKLEFNADFVNEFKASIKTQIWGHEVCVYVIKNDVFVEIEDLMKVKGNLEEIFEYLKSTNLVNFDVQNISFEQIKTLVLSVIKQNNIKIDFERQNENINGLKICADKFSCVLTFGAFEEIDYQESGEYQNVLDIFGFVQKMKDAISNHEFAFNINANICGYDVLGHIQYVENELQAKLSTKIIEKDLEIEIQNSTIYANFDGLKFKCAIEDVPKLAKHFESVFESSKNVSIPKFDFNKFLSEISLLFGEDTLMLAYKDATICVDAKNLKLDFEYNNIYASVTFAEILPKTEKQNYVDIYQLKDLVLATFNTLKNKSVSGNIDVVLNLFGEDNHFDVDYSVGIVDDKIVGKIFTTFKGLELKIYIENKDIYLDIASLKVHANVDEIDQIIEWINNLCETNISFDKNEIFSKDKILEKIKKFDFDIIESVEADETSCRVKLANNLEIDLEFDDYIRKIKFIQGGRSAMLCCTKYEQVDLSELDKAEFKDYTIFTKLIDSTYNLVKSKQFKINANISKFNNNALSKEISAKVCVDATSVLNAYVDVLGLDQQITVVYENKVMYFCYGGEKGLKIAIQEHALQEILSIVCSAMNIDVSSIPYLDEFIKKENIDSSNLSSILPQVEMKNPLDYVEYIESFCVSDTCFAITLSEEKLGDLANDKDVTIKIFYENGKITKIEVNNLCTNSSNGEYINVVALIESFEKIETISDKSKYIDLSDSKDLIRAFVNTSNLNDYHIKGQIKLNIDIGINFDAASIGVDARVKKITTKHNEFDEELGIFVEKEKTEIVGMIELSNYPIIAGVNNKNSNGGISRERTITIYFKDGNIYLSTVDAKKSFYDRLERVTKITSKYLFDNLKYYMQYLLGFTDTIQAKIDEAIDKSNNYQGETDYGNIILEYSKQNNKHTFVINLAEIAHNDYIGTLTLSLTTINNDSTQNKDYLHLLDVDLKLLNNMITLKTDESNQLYLIDIGKVVDITNAETFFAFYDDVNHFGQDGEYEKEGNGAWKQANTGTSEIRLISNGITVQTISGNIASKVDLPNLANIINDDGIVKREFKFAGWYYNEDCTEKFETSVFPRYNTTLFAKWIEFDPKYHATINFVSGIENLSVEPILGYVGDELILPILANIDKTVDENTSVLKEFLGWFTLDNEKFVQNVIESNNLTLFAKWSEKITKTYCLQIYSAGEKVYDGKVEAGKEFVFPNAPYFNETTRYYTNSNFDESSIVTNFVVNENSIWHARNKHTYKIASEHTTQTGGTSFEEGLCYEKEIVTLKTYSNFKIDKGTYWIEYEFKGYYLNGGTELFSGEYVMPSTDVSFVACWEKQEYCQVQFDVNSWEYPSWWTIKSWRGNQTNVSSVSNTDGNKIVIKRGAELKFDDYVATCECKYKINYKFKTAGWAENVSNIYDKAYDIKSLIITSNQTLKPVWKHA